MKQVCPKPLKTAQKAIVLHTFGVQEGSLRHVFVLSWATLTTCSGGVPAETVEEEAPDRFSSDSSQKGRRKNWDTLAKISMEPEGGPF